MKTLNLKLKTKIVKCEPSKIIVDIIHEEPEYEIIIPDDIMNEVQKLIIEEINQSKI